MNNTSTPSPLSVETNSASTPVSDGTLGSNVCDTDVSSLYSPGVYVETENSKPHFTTNSWETPAAIDNCHEDMVAEPTGISSWLSGLATSITEKMFSWLPTPVSPEMKCVMGSVACSVGACLTSFYAASRSEAEGFGYLAGFIPSVLSLSSVACSFFALYHMASNSILLNRGVVKVKEAVQRLQKLFGSLDVSSRVTSLLSTIAGCLQGEPTSEDVANIQKQFFDASASKAHSNALSTPSILNLITGLLSLVFTAVVSKFDWGVSSINNFLLLRERTSRLVGSTKDSIVDTLEQMGILDVNNTVVLRTRIEKVLATSHQLRRIPLVEMLTVSTYLTELLNAYNDIGEILHVQRKEHANTIRQYSAQLTKLYNEFGNLINEINSITTDIERPTTYGYILEGEPGIGKSTAIQYINTKVAEAMGWPTTQYDLSRGSSGRFNKPYGYQHLGVFNEFGAGRDDSLDYLADINKILSSDPFGFESASEKQKYQPCKLRLVGFSSNRDRYDFSRIMEAGANCALMSRLIRVEVADKDYTSRLADNLHRRSDFSHLELQIKQPKATPPTTLTDYWDCTRANINIHDLIDYLIILSAKSEIRYLRSLLNRSNLPESVAVAINERIPWLENIITARTVVFSFDTAIPSIFTAPKRTPKQINALTGAYGNASNACVINIAGEPATGKSLNAFSIAQKCRDVLHLPIVEITVRNIKSYNFPAAAVYLIQDAPWNDKEFQMNYMHFYNQAVTDNSVIVITTNHRFPLVQQSILSRQYLTKTALRLLGQHPPFDRHNVLGTDNYWIPAFEAVPGLIRRVGLSLASPHHNYSPATSQLTIWAEQGGFYAYDLGMLPKTVSDFCLDHIVKHMRTGSQVMFKLTTAPPINPIITLKIQHPFKFMQKLTSFTGILSLQRRIEGVGHMIVDLTEASSLSHDADIASFCLPKADEKASVDQLIHSYASRLRIQAPGLTFVAELPECRYVFDGKDLYKEVADESFIRVIDGIIHVEGVPVLPTEFAQFVVEPMQFIKTDTAQRITPCLLLELKVYYRTNISSLPAYNRAIIDLQTIKQPSWVYGKFTDLIRFLKSDTAKLLWNMFTCITTTILAFKTMSYMGSVVKRLKGHTNGASNSSTDVVVKRRPRQLRRKALRERSSAWENGHPQTLLAAAIDTGKSSQIMNAMDTYEDINALKQDLSEVLALNASENATPRAIRHSVDETPFTQAVSKIKRNLFKFQGKCECYGFFLRDRIGVVPRHAYDKIGSNFIHWSSSDFGDIVSVECKLIKQNKERDLVIVEVIDKKLPCMRNITHLLRRPPREDFVLDCYYVRPFSTVEIYGGTAYYSAAGNPSLGDGGDWDPSDYIEFVYSSCDIEHVYRSGDCGLPLLCIEDAQVRIVGFHIAKNDCGDGWFSALYSDELSNVTTAKPNSYDPDCYTTGPLQGMVAVPDWRGVLQNLSSTNIWENHPEILTLGYSRDVKWDIHPKPDKHCIWTKDCHFPLTSYNSPTRTELIPEETIPLLPKDKNGIPQPLLAQVKKYFDTIPFNPNQKHWKQAVHMTTQLCVYLTGGELKPLRGHEVLNGILGGSMRRIELSSSAGPRCKYLYKVQNKETLFKVDTSNPNLPRYAWDFDKPAARDVYADYNKILDAWSCGKPTGLVGQDVPKVELLASEDVEAGKLRLFVVCDLALNLALRKYFGSFIDSLHSRSLNTPFKIGWNPYLFPYYISLNERDGYEIVSIDIKRQDKNMNKEFIQVLCDIVCACYKNPCPMDFDAIAKTMSRMVHIHDGVIYWQEGGNPSGNYLTTVLNTICTFLGLTYSFIGKFEDKYNKIPTLPDFLTLVNPAGIGDDLRYAYHPDIDLNFKYVASKFLELGFEIVQDKGGIDPPPVHKGILCSRFFVWDDDLNTIIPPLKKRSIIQQLHYANLKDKGLFREIVQGVVFEAALHDKPFYNKIVKEAHLQLKKMKMKLSECRIAPYEAYREHLAKYQRGEVSSPLVTSNGYEIFKCSYANNVPYDRSDFKNPQDPITAYLLRVYDKSGRPPSESAVYSRESSSWGITLNHLGYTATAHSTCQASARRQAYRELYDLVFSTDN